MPNFLKKNCAICSVEFIGHVRALHCLQCRHTTYLEKKAEKKHIRLGHERINCIICGREFWTGKQRICMPCRSLASRAQKETAREKSETRREARLTRDIAEVQQPKRRKRPENAPNWKPSQKIPASCAACIYCAPREDFETGMACLAEAMLRCRPYAPNAQPLVRKEG